MELARFHRLRAAFYRLEASRCIRCQKISFPARGVCPACRSEEAEMVPLHGRGKVISVTRMYQAPRGYASSSTGLMALIELEEGVRLTAQLTDVDPEDVRIGMVVEMVIRRLQAEQEQGLIVYGYKFRPPIARLAQDHPTGGNMQA